MQTATQTEKPLKYGDLAYSSLHEAFVRVVAVSGCWVTVMDHATGKTLPDDVHESQLQRP